jgi:hypothetical protein
MAKNVHEETYAVKVLKLQTPKTLRSFTAEHEETYAVKVLKLQTPKTLRSFTAEHEATKKYAA